MSSRKVAVRFDEQKIDAIFAELNQCHLPGAAVGIAIDGKPVYRKGFGLASIELPVMLSPSTRMRIYSVTKHFTCLAYMLLCEKGKAGIDDTIGKYFPELNPITHQVTMRQLMGHIGGLRDSHSIHWQFGGTDDPVSSADLLTFYRDVDDAESPPGATWSYSNGGFLLLSVAIERITGKPLEDVLRERIFEPAGMQDSLLRRVNTDFVPYSATMHMVNEMGGYNRSYLNTALAGEGGIVSTVDDMLCWLANMDAQEVGSPETWILMKTPQVLINGTSTGYGLGLVTGRYRGVEAVYHAGGAQGANAQMMKVPEAGLDIAIMVNRHDVNAVLLADKIRDACLPGLEPLEEGSLSDNPVAGTFSSSTTGRVIHLFAKDGQQFMTMGGNEIPLELGRDSVLRPAGMYSSELLELTSIENQEEPDSIRVTHFGNRDQLQRVRRIDRADVDSIVGRYCSATTGTEAAISATQAGPQLQTVGRFGSMKYGLECLAEGVWRTQLVGPRPWLGGILAFERDNRIFSFSNMLMRQLPFQRCD